jgi:pimeloyl-ACP methyl ester carboxylesterase
MFRYFATILVAILLSAPLVAGITPFPASFHTQMVPTNGTSLYVRVGGKGPAVVLLHGFGDTGDMWAPLAIVLAKDHTVIVPDLRGMGMSEHPDVGYTKKNRRSTLPASWMHSRSRRQTWLHMTSAIWSAMRWPLNIRSGLRAGW